MEKFKAVYYERVSTVHFEQAESLENQRKLCESYLKRHPEIELAEPIGTYSERVSGKSDLRPKYNAMIKRIEKGDIDFLMVKDLKRLSRSMEVSSQLRNLVKRHHFKIILLGTSQIYDPNLSETRMIYGFESLVNEEVVFRQSEYGRIAHRQKMEAKRLNIHNIMFGYRWDKEKKDIVIDEEQAAIVRKIFDLYVFNSYGTKEIRQFLEEQNLSYSAPTVRKWLQETAYIGIFNMNKKGSELGVGSGQKTKRFYIPKDEWVTVERPDLAIIDKEVFDLAQKIRESRKAIYGEDKKGNKQARFGGFHLFSGKIFCGECGYSYTHVFADRKKSIGAYRDSFNQKTGNANKKCSNSACYRIYEEDLTTIVKASINSVIENSKDCFTTLLDVIKDVLSEERTKSSAAHEIRKRIASLNKAITRTKMAYMDAVEKGRSELAEDLGNDYDNLTSQLRAAERELSDIQNKANTQQKVTDRIAEIGKAMSELQSIKELDRSTVQTFIDRIIIHKDGRIRILLNTEEQIDTALGRKRRSRIDGSASVFMQKQKVEDVVKMESHDMTGLSAPSMPTAPMTCSRVLRPWSSWHFRFLFRLSAARLPPVLTF